MSDITTGQIRKALEQHFESILRNPNWDVIGDILGELDPDGYDPGVSHTEEEDFAYELWGRGRIVFDG